ncbi:hypothetical protein M5689_000447 [Euphorbia peplus]|nr:hypothetical protein M5689_000447 [Euphorbia peplus]
MGREVNYDQETRLTKDYWNFCQQSLGDILQTETNLQKPLERIAAKMEGFEPKDQRRLDKQPMEGEYDSSVALSFENTDEIESRHKRILKPMFKLGKQTNEQSREEFISDQEVRKKVHS